MKLLKFAACVLIMMPSYLFAQNAYDPNFDNNIFLDYSKDDRGDCWGEHYLVANKGNIDQNQCETECDNQRLCDGYSYKSGACLLKKNTTFCEDQDWKDNGYAYFAKPLELKLSIAPNVIKMKDSVKKDSNDNTINYCLQVPYDAQNGDKLLSTKCEVPGHKGQTFILEEVDRVQKIYKIKHPQTNLCVDILQYMIDENPVRLWDCDMSTKTDARKMRQYFKFQAPEIPKAMDHQLPFKVTLTTDHALAFVPGYVQLENGDCNGQDIKDVKNASPTDCKNACDLDPDCKGFNYKKSEKVCWLKKVNNCEGTRGDKTRSFYSKSGTL